jgi:hypothetical protein
MGLTALGPSQREALAGCACEFALEITPQGFTFRVCTSLLRSYAHRRHCRDFGLHLILILSRMCMILCQVAPVHLRSASTPLSADKVRLLFKGRPGSHSPQLCQGTLIERYQRRTRRSEILMGLIESDQREAVSVSCA